jgi:hypothetical protein
VALYGLIGWVELTVTRARRGTAHTVGMVALAGVALALMPVTSASASSFTWTGGSPGRTESAALWSAGANWEGDAAPATSQTIETLTFPHLESRECDSIPETATCYLALNDISGLTVESMRLDDADDYLLAGEGMTLGSGGLTAAPPAGTSGFAGSFMVMPLELDASQKWSIANHNGGEIEENGLLLGGELTGAGSALTVELSNGPALVLANSTEVGPVRIDGSNTGGSSNIANGSVLLEEGELNSSNGEPVDLSNVFFTGTGAVGALSTSHATLDVGSHTYPAEGLDASSVKLDSASGVIFEIMGSETTAQADYSQLVSKGLVELAGPIVVTVGKPSKTSSCPVLTPGQTYTFISTTGTLSGTFSDAPEDGAEEEIPIFFSELCHHTPQTMRIRYSRTGGTETVTGTVEAQAKERQEEEAEAREAKEREAKEQATKEKEEASRKAAEGARKVAEEAFAAEAAVTKKREEELTATKKHLEEEVAARGARGGVLGSKETLKSTPPTRTQLLAKALKQCRRQPQKKRVKCEAAARRRYGGKARRKKGRRK